MGQVVKFMGDTLRSLVNRMGTPGADKAASTFYVVPSLSDADLLSTYRATWLAKKIVDIPAFDSIRAWRHWQASKEEITAIEAEEKRLKVAQKVLQAQIKARLFGGAAIYIGTGDADLTQPLVPERIGLAGIQFITVMLKRHLTVGEIDQDPASEYFGYPSYYDLNQKGGTPLRIHPSRLILFSGNELPDAELISNQGFGDSVLLSLMKDIKNADATTQNLASLVFEAKIDIFSIPNLMHQLSDPQYEERLLNRLGLANMAKGINGALLMDSEETHEQKTINFSNLPEVLDRFLQIVAGAADIPVTRLLGQSPAGMNATGESDIRNYYDRISSIQNVYLSPALSLFDECLIRSALGSRPQEIFFNWASLWQISEKERAEIGKANADTISTLNATGLFPEEALANAGINMLVENGIIPGLEEAVEDAGGLPDYEAELLAAQAPPAANTNLPRRVAAGDGQIMLVDATPRTLYMRRDLINTEEFRDWAESQGFDTTIEDLHVTIVYSKTAFDWMKMGEDYGSEIDGQIVVNAGGPRTLEVFDGGAVVLEFSSSRLQWRHEDAKRTGANSDYDEYRPHITITYNGIPNGKVLTDIQPYMGPLVFGPEIYSVITPNPEITES